MFEQPGVAPHCPLNHAIDLVNENALPPCHKQYQLSSKELDAVQKHVDEMLEKGWMHFSVLPYSVSDVSTDLRLSHLD